MDEQGDEQGGEQPFIDGPPTGVCVRCGYEAIGGLCADCSAELDDFLSGGNGDGTWA